MDTVFKTTTEYMDYSEDVVEGVSSLKISEFEDPILSKDLKLKGVGEVFAKKYHPRSPMIFATPLFFLMSQKPQRNVRNIRKM